MNFCRGRLSLKIGHVERPEKDINIIEPQEKYIDETPYLSDIHSSMMKTHFSVMLKKIKVNLNFN